jgi:hypothetical protein
MKIADSVDVRIASESTPRIPAIFSKKFHGISQESERRCHESRTNDSSSLGQLRQTLESAGVSVDKLQVTQAPREHFTSNSNSRVQDRSPQQQAYERSARDDQQRREMLQRMWKRLTVGRDMLDLVA